MSGLKYIHQEEMHNLEAPRIIVPKLMQLLAPQSVIDIGCGIGTFLRCFKEQGVNTVLGVDGPWVNKDLLHNNISKEEFLEQDLETPLALSQKYDLVISLEVAEHLSAEAADGFVKNLVAAGDVILFSAAIPFQGGQNHINEQWLDYWAAKFQRHGYQVSDVLKPFFWEEKDVFWWYKQNMVLVTKNDLQLNLSSNELKDAIHPELFEIRSEQYLELLDKYQRLVSGKMGFGQYLKLLVKSIVGQKTVSQTKGMFSGSKKK